MTTVGRESDKSTLVDYEPNSDAGAFIRDDSMGTSLSIAHMEQRRSVAQLNLFLQQIAEGEWRRINYRGVDGENLNGWILLPPRYRSSVRVPLVTFVYGGWKYNDNSEPHLFHHINEYGGFCNLQLLAARGYAVLLPSMPLPPYPDGRARLGSDPYLELLKGVLPAVDKAVELGFADPNRLALMGHSNGGFSTYGIITQTHRFKAAIASAGSVDLAGSYGIFWSPLRYGNAPHEFYGLQALDETGQGLMGNPPWKDWERYVRNSPLSYVDRVQTPLLIVHGDMDFVPITEAEKFFTALYRQGKRARFVRYWGEGHGPDSPANIRDFWNQVYAWLDEFCDISRDAKGNLIFDGDHVKSRDGAPALSPEAFARFNEMELGPRPLKVQ
jgi:dipeptidyl aminopeptidase/acylaminoacyl peptidase